MHEQKPTPENFISVIKSLYGDHANQVLDVFPHANEKEVIESGKDLASDRFTAFSTWKWGDLQVQTGGRPVYRYYYSRPRPAMRDQSNQTGPAPEGAVHSAEIEYVFGVLKWKKIPWQPVDFKVSDAMMTYWSNFARTGHPDGGGLPHWPQYTPQDRQMLVLGPHIHARPATDQKRFEFLDSYIARYRSK